VVDGDLMKARAATSGDADYVAECLELAFGSDPVWELALRRTDGGTDHHRAYWRLFVDGAMRYGTVFVAEGGEAVSVWLPPGGTELDDAQFETLQRLLSQHLSPEGHDAILELYERFDASRSALPEHYYLSLLGTHPDHRGRGAGQALLAADLARWDAEGVPTYLESSNASNNHRYERAGYRPIGGFSAVRDDTRITAMWRSVSGT
jgi:GNAT superfamily N-acetyltransferase